MWLKRALLLSFSCGVHAEAWFVLGGVGFHFKTGVYAYGELIPTGGDKAHGVEATGRSRHECRKQSINFFGGVWVHRRRVKLFCVWTMRSGAYR